MSNAESLVAIYINPIDRRVVFPTHVFHLLSILSYFFLRLKVNTVLAVDTTTYNQLINKYEFCAFKEGLRPKRVNFYISNQMLRN